MTHDLEATQANAEQCIVEEGKSGERIDKYIADVLEQEASRSEVQQWIKNGGVTVNGNRVKANYKVASGDQIQVHMPEPEPVEIQAEAIPLDIVYEDDDVIVVNKPRGMVVHPAPGHYSGTLVNALMHHCPQLSTLNGFMRPGIVHRIDKDTSGLLVAAKHDEAHISLAAQMKAHSVLRKYIAVVHGTVQHMKGTVDAPIGRDPADRKQYTVTEHNSKHAVTHFVVLEELGAYTLMELQLETGRTHQIRVHMKFIGHPLVGDPAYGTGKHRAKWIQGQALHAGTLGFKHPRTGEVLEFHVSLPEDMEKLIHILRTQS